jgi:hydrogenase nickel incorporation protein HypA/HybF
MHESSLVRALLTHVREACQPYSPIDIDEVVIAIGPLAGVEPLLVASAFDLLTRDTDLEHARLVIQQVPLRLACQSCGGEHESDEITFFCPRCVSPRAQVIAGDGMILRHILLREPQEAAP